MAMHSVYGHFGLTSPLSPPFGPHFYIFICLKCLCACQVCSPLSSGKMARVLQQTNQWSAHDGEQVWDE